MPEQPRRGTEEAGMPEDRTLRRPTEQIWSRPREPGRRSSVAPGPTTAPGQRYVAVDQRVSRAGTVPAAQTFHLRKVYGHGNAKVVALNDVSVSFETGRFTAVMGASGSGKSTLMHCVAGLDAPTSGQIRIGDTEIGRLRDKQLTALRRDRIGFVFQAFNLVPTLTAEENIVLPLAIAGRKPDATWFARVIETVGLADRLGHKPSELSGGQQQRVACARALVCKPDIIFADEPTGNLDSRSGAEILSFLRRSVDEFGQTIVMVTHDPVAASYTDRVIFLADGDIVDELHHPTRERVLDTLRHLSDRTLTRRPG